MPGRQPEHPREHSPGRTANGAPVVLADGSQQAIHPSNGRTSRSRRAPMAGTICLSMRSRYKRPVPGDRSPTLTAISTSVNHASANALTVVSG